MPAVAPDKWGSIGSVPTGLTEDRWVKSVEVREVNDIPRDEGTKTVGGRYVFHHMTYRELGAGRSPAAPAGRFTRSAATPTCSPRRPAGCWPPTRCSI